MILGIVSIRFVITMAIGIVVAWLIGNAIAYYIINRSSLK